MPVRTVRDMTYGELAAHARSLSITNPAHPPELWDAAHDLARAVEAGRGQRQAARRILDLLQIK